MVRAIYEEDAKEDARTKIQGAVDQHSLIEDLFFPGEPCTFES